MDLAKSPTHPQLLHSPNAVDGLAPTIAGTATTLHDNRGCVLTSNGLNSQALQFHTSQNYSLVGLQFCSILG